MKKLKTYIEKWAVATLYNQSFNQYNGRINKKTKKIFFDMFGASLFKNFGNQKQHLAISILVNWYGYKCYEENILIPFVKHAPKRIDHTWGEVQDIIRAYNTIPIPAIKPLKVPPVINELLHDYPISIETPNT